MLEELGSSRLGEVRPVGDHLPPVAGVRQRRHRIGPQRADRVGKEQQRVRHDTCEQYEERGKQAPSAPHVERSQRHPTGVPSLAQEQ